MSNPSQDLSGRRLLLGITGGIAAYKSAYLCRLFIKAGAEVQVVMTAAGTKFVTPLTFETITARQVYTEMFPERREVSPWHTELASWAELAVIAPATANHIAKLACGLADDLLSTIMLTFDRARVLAPAMNHRMWENVATQENLRTLRARGYTILEPPKGDMARPGETAGFGRMQEPEDIFREVARLLTTPRDLKEMRVLVTAGRTEEAWDPVRILTNRSTGRMGFALAEEARERGAEVILVHGPTEVMPPAGVRAHAVVTAAQMANAVRKEAPDADMIFMAAAVSDYRFENVSSEKIKKNQQSLSVSMKQTEDILANLPRTKPKQIIVGFALETENLLENALKKLHKKKLDLVIGNNPLQEGSGFGTATNEVMLINRDGSIEGLPLLSKREVAREILERVVRLWHEKQSGTEQHRESARPRRRRTTHSARRKSAQTKKTQE
ncbi:bifunctional phosphopantothenoylcysteine decarboxylase/phosphopantothenate--cysteine ligase CoaBC [bacterium]|nr:bifunctional phosphopantothenoylcysteine decarboxylase/phosphopantothenate--cysteine ligase CoaBC [bacterium]